MPIFYGALPEGAEIHAYGQGQSHWGMKADSGWAWCRRRWCR